MPQLPAAAWAAQKYGVPPGRFGGRHGLSALTGWSCTRAHPWVVATGENRNHGAIPDCVVFTSVIRSMLVVAVFDGLPSRKHSGPRFRVGVGVPVDGFASLWKDMN